MKKQNYLFIKNLKQINYRIYLFLLQRNMIIRQIPKCIKNNQAYVMCWTRNCKVITTICNDNNCQCSKTHNKCFNNITVNTFLNHLNQLNKVLPDTSKLKAMMIEGLQKLRKQMNVIINAQIQNINLKYYEPQESVKFKKIIQDNQVWTSQSIEYCLNLKQIKIIIANNDIQPLRQKLKTHFNVIKENLKTQIQNIMKINKYNLDYKPEFKGTDIYLKSFTKNFIEFQYKPDVNKFQDLILPKALDKTTKLFIHATNLTIKDKKPYWFAAGIINKTNINFNTGNQDSSIAVSSQGKLFGNIKKIEGNGIIQQKNECLYELEYNRQYNYLLIKIGSNKYRLGSLPKLDYYVIIGMGTVNTMVSIYE